MKIDWFTASQSTNMQLAQAAGAARAAQAGVAGAVRGQVQQVSLATPATAPATVGRNVISGDAIFLGDRITTGADAGLQVMLMDQTVFQIGPNAALTIDEFVYNPETSAGRLTASIAKGAFRFVTGRIAQRDPESMTVRLPVATVGIRGTIVAGVTDDTSATVILVGPGQDNNSGERAGRILVSNAGAVVEISRPGFATTIASAAVAPQAPVRATTAQMNQVNRGLSASGQRAQERQPAQQQPQGGQARQQQQGQQQQGQQQPQGQQQGQQQQGQQQPGQQQAGQPQPAQQQQAQGQQQPGQVQQGQVQQGQQQVQLGQVQAGQQQAQIQPGQVQQQSGTQQASSFQGQQMQSGQPTQTGQQMQSQPMQGQQPQAAIPSGPIQGGQTTATAPLTIGSVARTSGQTAGGAIGNLRTVQNVQVIQTGALNPTTQVAQNEQTIRAGVATFEEVRRITTGTAVYNATNVPLTGDGAGSYNFSGTVDFARMTATYSVDGRYTLAGVSGTFQRLGDVHDYRLDASQARTTDPLFVSGGPGVGRPGEHRGNFELALHNSDRRVIDFARTKVTITNGNQTVMGTVDTRRP